MGFKEIANEAQGALTHHGVRLVFINIENDQFLPKDVDHASDGFTRAVYTWDSSELRKIEPADLLKVPRSVDGSTYMGLGVSVYRPAAAPVKEPSVPPAVKSEPAVVVPLVEAPPVEAPAVESPVADPPVVEAPKAKAKK